MANKSRFLGWEIYLKTEEHEFDTEIVDLMIGHDIASLFPMATIKLSIDTSFIKCFAKPHTCKLLLVNRLIYTEENSEMFEIDLQAVTNPSIIIERESDEKRSRITRITVRYMCLNGVTIVNRRVCGIYHKKKLKDIVKDLHQQTKSKLQLKFDPEIENQNEYECITIEESSFIQAIRYLHQRYGFYNNLFCTFAETFTTGGEKQWFFGNIDKLIKKRKKGSNNTKFMFARFEEFDQPAQEPNLEERKYYIYTDVAIRNNFMQIVKRMPQMLKFFAFEENKFIKRLDVKIVDVIKQLPFLQSTEQFEKKMEYGEEPYYASRFDITKYSLNHMIQDLGLTAYQMPDIIVPNPIKIEHFLVGTEMEFESKQESISQTNDLHFWIAGFLLHIRQGDGKSGGATWSTTMKIRPVAASPKGIKD